jgi:type IV pilus assembly protein PilN
MRFNINLASQPYEAAQQFRRRIGAVVAALGLLAVLLVGYIVYQRIHSRDINQQLSEVRQEIDSLNQEEAQARATLNKPENRDVADRSQFLNQLFARKSLSWTRVFAGMERIVPPDLHVVSMKPEYNKTNDLILHVVVATGSRDRAVELVRRIEKSPHFRQAEIVAENVTTNVGDQGAGQGNIQFDIAAVYLPSASGADAAEEDKGGDNSGGMPRKAASRPSAAPAASRTPAANHLPAQVQAQNQPRAVQEKGH